MDDTLEDRLAHSGAVVVDDEPLPRAHLMHLLREAGVGRVYEARDADECRLLFARDTPIDWAFLDVRMPGADGLALADALNAPETAQHGKGEGPALVFVTGYDDYALQAFDRAAVDYLLKPVERVRLDETLRRLLSQGERTKLAPPEPPPLPRLPIRTAFATRLVDTEDILAAYARDKRVEIITSDATYPTHYTLNGLEQRLPLNQFLRVHESWIVNVNAILEIHSLGSQAYQLQLRGGALQVPVSRRRLPQLQKRLGL
jgi:two-component system response regulator LytT